MFGGGVPLSGSPPLKKTRGATPTMLQGALLDWHCPHATPGIGQPLPKQTSGSLRGRKGRSVLLKGSGSGSTSAAAGRFSWPGTLQETDLAFSIQRHGRLCQSSGVPISLSLSLCITERNLALGACESSVQRQVGALLSTAGQTCPGNRLQRTRPLCASLVGLRLTVCWDTFLKEAGGGLPGGRGRKQLSAASRVRVIQVS